MKKLLLGICLTFISLCLQAQNKDVLIRIINEINGDPVSFATVEVKESGSFVAGENGELILPGKITGSQRVIVTASGYTDFNEILEINSGVNTIFLKPVSLFLKPVEIIALRANDKAPFAKVNISKHQIEQNNLGQDLPFLLSQTPSIIVNSDAGNGIGYTGIRIRGSDATRINMTINGIPYNDSESQGLFFVNLPDLASSLESIQVQRGVGTSSNGAGAFGATMNFSTNEVNLKPSAEINN